MFDGCTFSSGLRVIIEVSEQVSNVVLIFNHLFLCCLLTDFVPNINIGPFVDLSLSNFRNSDIQSVLCPTKPFLAIGGFAQLCLHYLSAFLRVILAVWRCQLQLFTTRTCSCVSETRKVTWVEFGPPRDWLH